MCVEKSHNYESRQVCNSGNAAELEGLACSARTSPAEQPPEPKVPHHSPPRAHNRGIVDSALLEARSAGGV